VRPRLALTAAAVTAMIVIAFCIPLGRLIQVVATNRALDAARLESRSLAGALSAVTDTATVKQLVQQANAGNPRPTTVYLPDDTVLGAAVPVDPEVELARQGRSFTAAGPHGGRDILVGLVEPDGSARVVRVRVAGALLNRGVHRAWTIIVAIGALVVLIAVILADRLGQSIVAPMGELLSVTRRLQGGELQARVEPAGPPEVEEVGIAVNDLAARIGDLLAAERESAADLSHQLRTPLTVLRLDAEGLESAADRVRLASDIDQLEQVVTRVIKESRGTRQGSRSGQGRADLGKAVRDRLAFWSVLAEDQGRHVSSTIPTGSQPIGVAVADLDVCIDALLNNVFTHTPAGTDFSVEVAPAYDRGWTLVVRDSGPGLPGDSLPTRGTSGGSGTGLGLDIIRRTAEGSGGSVTAGHSFDGGARIEVTFGPPAG